MLIILRSLIIGILLRCDLLINTDITCTRKVIFFSPLIPVREKHELHIVFYISHLIYFHYFLNWWMFFFLRATGRQLVEKWHLAASSSAGLEITEWKREPSASLHPLPACWRWCSTRCLNITVPPFSLFTVQSLQVWSAFFYTSLLNMLRI